MKTRIVMGLAVSLVLSAAWLIKTGAAPQAGSPVDVREFVRQTFFEGVPYEEASRYDGSVVPTLLAMLADLKEEPYWSNIVVTLGMIGDDRAVDPMIAFINKGATGTLSHAQYTARTSAVISLGYIVNKSKNAKALTYLKDSLNPQAWDKRETSWKSPYQASTEDRNIQLSTAAILGLALSGDPSAAEALRKLQQPADTEPARRFQAQTSSVAADALTANEMIAKEGLAAYYRKTKK